MLDVGAPVVEGSGGGLMMVTQCGGGEVVTRDGDSGMAAVAVSTFHVVWVVVVVVGIEGGRRRPIGRGDPRCGCSGGFRRLG